MPEYLETRQKTIEFRASPNKSADWLQSMAKSISLVIAVSLIATLCGCTRNATSDTASSPSEPMDADLLIGTWEITSATINGDSFPVEGQLDMHIGGKYLFDGETLTKYPNPDFPGIDQAGTRHRYQVRAEENPKQIEIQMQGDGPNGPWPPETSIYRLEEDSLTLCWSILGETIPDGFESKPGENIGLYELRRVKE